MGWKKGGTLDERRERGEGFRCFKLRNSSISICPPSSVQTIWQCRVLSKRVLIRGARWKMRNVGPSGGARFMVPSSRFPVHPDEKWMAEFSRLAGGVRGRWCRLELGAPRKVRTTGRRNFGAGRRSFGMAKPSMWSLSGTSTLRSEPSGRAEHTSDWQVEVSGREGEASERQSETLERGFHFTESPLKLRNGSLKLRNIVPSRVFGWIEGTDAARQPGKSGSLTRFALRMSDL